MAGGVMAGSAGLPAVHPGHRSIDIEQAFVTQWPQWPEKGA